MRHKMRYVQGHVELYDQAGQFLFSADDQDEALRELEEYLSEQEMTPVVA